MKRPGVIKRVLNWTRQKKKKRKESITDTCPAYAIAEIYGTNYILCSLYSLPHRRESFLKISSDITAEIIAAFSCKLLEVDLRGIPISREKYQRITKFRMRNSSFFKSKKANSLFLVGFFIQNVCFIQSLQDVLSCQNFGKFKVEIIKIFLPIFTISQCYGIFKIKYIVGTFNPCKKFIVKIKINKIIVIQY